jgi:hypothetical protein
MYLQEIKIIDLRTSKWDKAKSNPAKGDYFFTDKRYISYRGERAAAPPFKFVWARYHGLDHFRDVRDYQTKWKATAVDLNDPYWPEGVVPDNGRYVEGDSILMKIPIMEYAKKRKAEIQRSESRPEAVKRQFHAELQGLGADVSDEEIDRLLSSRMG